MLDLLAARNSIEGGEVIIKWVPSKRNLADILTRGMDSECLIDLLLNGVWCLKPSPAEVKEEEHLAALRKGQRERRKARAES